MKKKIGWGILGCGGIAGKFAEDLAHSKYGYLRAAGSRELKKGKAFAKRFGAEAGYGSYEEVVNDAGVDAVYVATLHPFHMENSLLAIAAGKAVLCEKPFTMNAGQAKRVVEAAREKGVFLMEAMWARFFPAMEKVREWLKEGRIGEVVSLQADFGYKFEVGPEHRIFNPELGGGALLDLGVYVVSLASMVYGHKPAKIVSVWDKGRTGVDEHEAILFQYGSGATANLSCSSRVTITPKAKIWGTKGGIEIEENFYCSRKVKLKAEGQRDREVNYPYPGSGYQFEAEHAARCIMDGKSESEIMGVDETVSIMETLDAIRRPWGLKYPNE